MGFFDEMVNRGMLFLSVHDAILYIKMETGSDMDDPMADKVDTHTYVFIVNITTQAAVSTAYGCIHMYF